MNDDEYLAVGGVGGSGTRLVAEILQRLGFYLGPVRNQALDCLLFTLFFRRPAWFDAFPPEAEVRHTARLFIGAMQNGLESQLAAFGASNFDRLLEELERYPGPTGLTREKIRAMRAAPPPDLDNYVGLAWKEPNTHIFLPQFAQQFPRLKYVHVIRNGLDMALSKNLHQLHNWGGFFGIQTSDEEPLRIAQLRYWIAANRRVLDIGQSLMADRFLLLNYDALCERPEPEITRLVRFSGVEFPKRQMTELAGSIAPTSRNRFRSKSADLFNDEHRAAVRAFGFDAD